MSKRPFNGPASRRNSLPRRPPNRKSTPRGNVRPGGVPSPSTRRGSDTVSGGGCLLTLAITAMAVGGLAVLSQLYAVGAEMRAVIDAETSEGPYPTSAA